MGRDPTESENRVREVKLDINVLEGLASSYALILIPIVAGLVEVLKRFIPESLVARWMPVLALVIAVCLSWLVIGSTRQAAVVGVIIGLSSSGLYSTTKAVNPFKKPGG